MVKCDIGNYADEYGDFSYERIRFIAPLSSGQWYVMEAENTDYTNDEEVTHLYWNIYQCIVENAVDEEIYTVDYSKIVGRAPLETLRLAKRALREIEEYLEDTYEGWDEQTLHHLQAGWADERRRSAYSKVLTKLGGWTFTLDVFEQPCYEKVIKGKYYETV